MGIAGAGNSGTVLAVALHAAPRGGVSAGRRRSAARSLPMTALAALVFLRAPKDSPNQPPPTRARREYIARAARSSTRSGSAVFYSITFGGFVGLRACSRIFFHDQYRRRAKSRPAI